MDSLIHSLTQKNLECNGYLSHTVVGGRNTEKINI